MTVVAFVFCVPILRVISPLPYHWRDLPQISFLSRQNDFFCRDKSMLVVVMSRQKVCTFFGRNKHSFVATKHVCYRDKKMILVAAPADDSYQQFSSCYRRYLYRNSRVTAAKLCHCMKHAVHLQTQILQLQFALCSDDFIFSLTKTRTALQECICSNDHTVLVNLRLQKQPSIMSAHQWRQSLHYVCSPITS